MIFDTIMKTQLLQEAYTVIIVEGLQEPHFPLCLLLFRADVFR